MAVIRLVFDIDPEVHPELHAMLSSITSEAARGERLRQLAATGLLWERVRIEGQPAALAPPGNMARPPVATAAPVQPPVPVEMPAEPAIAAPAFVPMAARPAPPIELPPVDPLALREFEEEIERAARELPELFDVLEPGDYPLSLAAAAAKSQAAPAPPAFPSSAANDPAQEAAAPPVAPARSRLMRMKDKGLFKNE